MKASRLRRLIEWLKRKLRPAAPPDPYAYKPVPLRRGPKDRSGAVAVEEPEDDCT